MSNSSQNGNEDFCRRQEQRREQNVNPVLNQAAPRYFWLLSSPSISPSNSEDQQLMEQDPIPVFSQDTQPWDWLLERSNSQPNEFRYAPVVSLYF